MTCDTNHARIEHGEATCPLCAMIDLCHEQEHELQTLRPFRELAKQAVAKAEEAVAELVEANAKWAAVFNRVEGIINADHSETT